MPLLMVTLAKQLVAYLLGGAILRSSNDLVPGCHGHPAYHRVVCIAVTDPLLVFFCPLQAQVAC